MKSPPPVCKTIGKWLKHHLGKDALAPLTGQDVRALHSFVHLLELYAVSDKSGKFGAAIAMAATVQSMQTSVRTLAKRSIPHVLDWGDEEQLWTMIQSVLMVFASAEARGLKPLTEESFH